MAGKTDEGTKNVLIRTYQIFLHHKLSYHAPYERNTLTQEENEKEKKQTNKKKEKVLF